MKIIVLGSGTCVPSLQRNAPGYFCDIADRGLLIDCGSGTLLQLEKAGRSYKDIDYVFITHMHPDHVSDLVPLVHALRATPGYVHKKTLSIIGPPGIERLYHSWVSLMMKSLPKFPIQITEMEQALDLEFVRVLSAKTVHTENSIAYRFEAAGKSAVITGDCDYDQGLVDLTRNADLLVLDCAFPDEEKVRGHMTPRECGLVAKRANVKHVILSHLYPSAVPDSVRLNQCKSVFEGDVQLAHDLMEVDI